MIIDVHSHFHSRHLEGKAGSLGPTFITGDDGRTSWQIGDRKQNAPRPIYDLEERLRCMDEAGVDIQVVAISPKWYLYNFIHQVPIDTSIHFAKLQNDDLARIIQAAPHRLQAFATLPLQDIQASVTELRRALDMGFKGIIIDSVVQGQGLGNELLYPIYELLQKNGKVLFIHPSFLPDQRIERMGFRWMMGFCFDETYALACLVFDGVLDQFPDLKVLITHGGGAMPYVLGRLVDGPSHRADTKVKSKHPFDHYLSRFYYDACLYDPRPLEYLVSLVGPDNVVFGTNYPGSSDAAPVVVEQTRLDDVTKEKILHHNPARLLGLE